MSFETVCYKKEGSIAWLTLNRPKALNSINIQMRDDLWEVITAIRDDSEIRVAVICGAGDRSFSAGGDLTEFGTAPSPIHARRARQQRDLWNLILSIDKPLIAAIHGFALGAGLQLALCCDIRIATEEARFGLPEVKLAYIPSSGETQLLPRIVPLAIAKEMALTGNPIDGRTALRIGLVRDIVSRNRLKEEATNLAELLLTRAPLAIRAVKEGVRRGIDLPLADGLALEHRLATRLLTTTDAKEGLTASAQGRKPEFQGI